MAEPETPTENGEEKPDFDTIVEDNRWPPYNPVVPDRKDYGGENADPIRTVGLTQVTMGAPRSLYNGGLLRATVRYFDVTPSLALPGLASKVRSFGSRE